MSLSLIFPIFKKEKHAQKSPMVNYIRLEPWKQEICKCAPYFPESLNWNLIFSSLSLIYVKFWFYDFSGLDLLTPSSWHSLPITPGPMRYIEDDVRLSLHIYVMWKSKTFSFAFILLLIKPITLSFTLIGTCRNQSGDLWTTQLMSAPRHQPFVPSCASKVSIS